ncbi:MAG: DoxX family protein [Pseudomonadota bacterium]
MKYFVWVGMAIVSAIMIMGGTAKLTGNPMVLESFAQLGLPRWFATFIGVAEVAGAVGIWLRPTSRYAAAGIAIIMVGALYYHISFPPLSGGAPAAVILLICGYIVSRRGTGVVL